MTITIREIMKYKWDKITLFLRYTNITYTMSWISVITSQMTMISNFIRFNNFFHKIDKRYY